MNKSQQPRHSVCITCGARFAGSWTGECPPCEQKAIAKFVSQPQLSEQQEWTPETVRQFWRDNQKKELCDDEQWNTFFLSVADAHNAALAAEREKRDRVVMDSQSWGGLKLEWRESDGRHYLYDKDGNFLWSGAPSYNIWRCVKLIEQLAAERQRREQAEYELADLHSEILNNEHDAALKSTCLLCCKPLHVGICDECLAEVRKPLVKLLERTEYRLRFYHGGGSIYMSDIIGELQDSLDALKVGR